MYCPACKQTLEKYKNCFICPNSDGALITNRQLVEKDENLITGIDANRSNKAIELPQRDTEIACPHCGAAMHLVDYNFTGIMVDSCTGCHYRWLDKGEFRKIKDHKPRMKGEDILFLLDLEQKIETLDKMEKTKNDPNAEVPLYASGWGGFVRGGMAGNSRRTLGWLLTAGMFGLITGIIKSKLIRIVAPFIILGFAILGYLIWKQVKLIHGL